MIAHISEYFADLVSPDWQWDLVFTNLVMIFGFLFIFKFKVAWLTSVSINEELAHKDNPAFGVNLAFAFFSFFLVMGAASTGDTLVPLMQEVKLMAVFGIFGMAMLLISKVIFDKVAMRSFALQEEIRKENVAAALVDGSNMFATALIVFAYMSWVKGTEMDLILLVGYGWIMSQIMLSGLNIVRSFIFKSSDGLSLQDTIKDGNMAVAIRYSAYKVSFALTALVASGHYPYQVLDSFWYANAILVSSVLLATLIVCLTFVAKKIILPNIDFADEINRQKNTGLATIESLLVLGINIAFYALLK